MIVEHLVVGVEESFLRKHVRGLIWSFLKEAILVPRDAATIGKALCLAPAWPPITILISSGTYEESLDVRKPVTLLGERGVVLATTGSEPTLLFSCEGEVHPRAVQIEVRSAQSCAVFACGRATVKTCKFSSSRSYGVLVRGSSCPTVEDCEFHDCHKAGVVFRDQVGGTIRRSKFYDNSDSGILCRGVSHPTLENNTFLRHRRPAVFIQDEADALVKTSLFEDNSSFGIVVCHQAGPRLEGNTFLRHTMPAIALQDETRTVVTRNYFEANEGICILVRHKSEPILEANEFKFNRAAAKKGTREIGAGGGGIRDRVAGGGGVSGGGTVAPVSTEMSKVFKRAAIAFQEEARGTVHGNRFEANEGYGILVTNKAGPVVKNNDIIAHRRPAIAVRDEAAGVIRSNRLRDNGYGIVIQGKAACTVEENELSGHTAPAIAVRDNARPVVRRNRLFGNATFGIHVCCASTPQVEENECSSNGPSIMFQDTAGGIVRGNRIVGGHGIVVLDFANPLVEGNESVSEQLVASLAPGAIADAMQRPTSAQLKKRRLE